MVLIGDLFERDPTRKIRPVASVREHNPEIVYEELDEYVVTEYIQQDLRDILDLFIESRRGAVENVCCWITGFFGSGKSIFLKLLGYILGNLELALKSGEKIEAGNFFLNKHGLKAHATILYKELKTIPLFINLLDLDVAREPSITRIVYTELLRVSGLSKIPWIAEIERTIQQRGLKKDFLELIAQTEGKNWEDVREIVLRARPVLARALCKLDSESYPTREDATKSIEDVEKSLEITPSFLVRRLLEKAEELDPSKGRIVILLDEAGQYLDRPERLADLNILAEEVSKSGQGKIWLFVTAQEALEDVLSRVPHTPDIARLRDRFQKQLQLTPENIDTVTKKRMLEKKADPKTLGILREAYKNYKGTLWTSAMLKGVKRDYGSLFERDESLFIESYPFMPFHIRLMQEIFNILRGRGAKITGRERTALTAVNAIMSGIKNRKGLAYMPVGYLVTFDMIYDVLEEELKAISSSEEAAIERISKLGKRGEIEVASVAKVLFLLQNVEWIPCTVENIAAVLYPQLGADINVLENSIRECLKTLIEGLWVAEKQGTYRLLSEFERSFEKLVKEKRSEEDIPIKKRQLSHSIIEKLVKEQWKFNKFVYKGVPFDIYILADDKDISAKGHIQLHIFSPLQTYDKELIQRLKRESLRDSKVIYWVCESSDAWDEMLERAVCTEKVLGEFKPLSHADRSIVEEQRSKLHLLKEDELPHVFEQTLTRSFLIYNGDETLLDGKRKVEEIFRIYVERAVKEVFPDFELAPFRLEKDPQDIIAILKWRGGSLPQIYKNLQLVDEYNNILTDRPVASRILEYLKSRKVDERRGAAILEYFASPTYGWEGGIVRLTLATLFRNGSITAIFGNKPYTSVSEAGSHEVFTNTRVFNKTLFEIGGAVITPKQRDLALKLISDIFGRKAGPTIDEIDDLLSSEVETATVECSSLLSKAELINLPSAPILKNLEKTLSQIKADTRVKRILNFLECCEKEEQLNEFKYNLKTLKRLKQFDFSEYQKVSTFSREIAFQLSTLLKSTKPDIVRQTESLRDCLAAEDFLDRWTTIRGTFEKLKKGYEEEYLSLHNQRHELIQEAIQQLKSHAALHGLSAEEKTSHLRPLLEIDCSEVSGFDERFACRKCGSSLDRLSWHISIVEKRRLEIEGALDKLQAKRKPVTVSGFEETITKLNQIATVAEKVKDTSRKAVAQGKTVKVAVEVRENRQKSQK